MFHSLSHFEMMRCQVFGAFSPVEKRRVMSVCVCALQCTVMESFWRVYLSQKASWWADLVWGFMFVCCNYVFYFLMNTSDLPPEHFCLNSAFWTLLSQFCCMDTSDSILTNFFLDSAAWTFFLQFCTILKRRNGFLLIYECEFELNWQPFTGSWIF